MALSDSTDFNLNAQRIAREALELCGVVAPSEIPASADIEQAYRAMNLVTKQLGDSQQHPWKWVTSDIPVVADQQLYTIGPAGSLDAPRPAGLRFCGYADAGEYLPLLRMTRGEWERRRGELSGDPRRYNFRRTLTEGEIRVTPTPDAQSTGTLRVLWKRPFDDFDTALNDPDFPPEWLNALIWLTAAELLSRYTVPQEQKQRIEGRASIVVQALLQED